MPKEERVEGVAVEDGTVAAALSLADISKLAVFFGDPVPAEELVTWAGMAKVQRDKALQRMAALERYCASGSELTAIQAAADAGVKVGRFYQMARLWPGQRSLRSLGAFASATKPRQKLKAEVTNALQSTVARVLDEHPGASIATLARTLGSESGLPPGNRPAQNTLRLFVERELRRRKEAEMAGTELLFDFSATSLIRKDGRPHDLFLVIDDGTGLILGHALGLAMHAAAAYRAAAADALRRIPEISNRRSIWAPRLMRSQMVPGDDSDSIAPLLAIVRRDIGGAAPQMTSGAARGRYIRPHIGLKLGTVRLIPSRVGAKFEEPGDRGFTAEDGYARIELGVAEHNAGILARLAAAGRAFPGEDEPPGEMLRMLEIMASWPSSVSGPVITLPA